MNLQHKSKSKFEICDLKNVLIFCNLISDAFTLRHSCLQDYNTPVGPNTENQGPVSRSLRKLNTRSGWFLQCEVFPPGDVVVPIHLWGYVRSSICESQYYSVIGLGSDHMKIISW